MSMTMPVMVLLLLVVMHRCVLIVSLHVLIVGLMMMLVVRFGRQGQMCRRLVAGRTLRIRHVPAGAVDERPALPMMVMAVHMAVAVAVVGRGRRHVVPTVRQMGRVRHPYLVPVMVRHMPLGRFDQRRLDVCHKLGHLLRPTVSHRLGRNV